MKQGSVLVIDDDPIALEQAKERLTRAGYRVFLRDQSLGATAVIAKDKPDFVLLDVNMPGLSGDRLADILRDHTVTKHTRIILHSSKSRTELHRIALRTGVLGAIEKTASDRDFVAHFEALAGHDEPVA